MAFYNCHHLLQIQAKLFCFHMCMSFSTCFYSSAIPTEPNYLFVTKSLLITKVIKFDQPGAFVTLLNFVGCNDNPIFHECACHRPWVYDFDWPTHRVATTIRITTRMHSAMTRILTNWLFVIAAASICHRCS